MKTVWKFELAIHRDECRVEMPKDADPVRVGMQGRTLCLWAIVDPTLLFEARLFLVRGTGHGAPDSARYIGSVDDGPFVWHVFEQPPEGAANG